MDANFIGEVLDYLKCIVCHLVLRDPVLLVGCGHRLCQECFNQTREHAVQTHVPLLCPHDRNQVDVEQVVQDKGIARAILDLKVSCDHACDGCLWSGELRSLQDHLDTRCSATALKRLTKQMEERFVEKDEKLRELEAKFQNSIEQMEEKVRVKERELIEKYGDKEEKMSHMVQELQLMNGEMQHMMQSAQLREEKMHRIEEKILLKDEEIASLKYDVSQLKMELFRSKKGQSNSIDAAEAFQSFAGSSGWKKPRSLDSIHKPVPIGMNIAEDDDEEDNGESEISKRNNSGKKRVLDDGSILHTKDAQDRRTNDELIERCHQKDVEIGLLKLRLARMSNELFNLRRDTSLVNMTDDDSSNTERSKTVPVFPKIAVNDIFSPTKKDAVESESEYPRTASFLGKRNSSGRTVNSHSSLSGACKSSKSTHCSSQCSHCNRLQQLEQRFMNVDDFVPNNYTKFTWKITHFSHHQNVGESLMSPKFYSSLHGHCCVLTLRWPEPDKHLALYFSLCRGNYGEVSSAPFNTNIRLQCTDKNGVENEWTIRHANLLGPGDERSPGRGYHEFIRKESLVDYVVNDSLTITCIL